MKKDTFTESKAENNPSGGVLVGKRKGQTIIHNKGSLSGYLVGKTHDEGGIKAINKSTGQPLEMQGGEVVITAPAVADQTKREFEGEMLTNREILSKINEKGGGVSFAKGGDIPEKMKCSGASYNYGGKTMTDHEIMMMINNGGHLAKGMTLKDIAEKHDVSISQIKEQVKLGLKAESEHTSSKREQMKIVKDHLFENPEYYTLLKEAGLEKGGAIKTWKQKYNKKYGYAENESHDLEEIAKDTGISLKGLQQIYDKGIGAYKTNPESVRPNVKSKEQWAMARVYSAVMGGKASKVDANELKMKKFMIGGYNAKTISDFENPKEAMEYVDKEIVDKAVGIYIGGKASKVDANELKMNNGGEIERALDDLEKARSVKGYMQPEFNSETYDYPKQGKANSYVKKVDDNSKTILAYDNNGEIVGLFSISTNVNEEGAFKIVVREDSINKGWGKKLLDEAEKQNIDIVGNIKNNSFTSSGRYLLRSWLKSKNKFNSGGEVKEDLVKDSKKGDHPARDLNNYNDLMDVGVDGEVGELTGLELADGVGGADASGGVGAFDNGGEVSVETILFGVRIGEPDWKEVLITNNPDKIEDAKKWALANGFDRLRVSKIDIMEKPDFTKTFDDGGDIGCYADGGATLSAIVFEWDKVPTNYRNISKVKKVPFSNNPMDKGLDSIISPFLSKDELRPVMTGINFDDNGITATNAHILITLPYPNKKYDGVYDVNKAKKTKSDEVLLINEKYPNYEAVIPKSENAGTPYLIDVYKLLQYTKTALNYTNKVTHAIAFKYGEDERIGFNGKFLSQVLTTALKLGHEKIYVFIQTSNRGLVLSPNKNYELGNDEILLTMPVILTSAYGTITGYGTSDPDYNRSLKAYFDFNDNEIHNADGSVAEFKMQYENNLSVDDDYLALLTKITSKRNRVPILDYAKVENGKMTATDLDISLIVKDVNMPDGIYEIVNKAPNITMKPLDDFPSERVFDKDEYETHFKEKRETAFQFVTFSEVFEFYLDKLLLSVGKDDLRPIMSGICIKKTSDNQIFLVSTDAHTLCKINITEYCEFNKDSRELEYTLPVKYLKDFVKLTEGALHFKCSKANMFIESENLEYIARTIDGNYPNYNAVIPRSNTKKIVFDHVAMNKCLKSQKMTDLLAKYKGQKDILVDFSNIGNTLYVKVSNSAGYNKTGDTIEVVELCNIDLNYQEVETEISLDQSVFLLMPSKDEFKENQYFSFRKEFFEVMLDTITDTEVECYFTEPNKAYIFPIDAIDYKKTLPKEKTKEQKLSTKELQKLDEIQQITEAIEVLKILLETSRGKKKKEIEQAIEVLQMLNEN